MTFTTGQIEALLSQPEYAPIKRLDKKALSDEQKQEIQVIEQITSFGNDIITLWDDMVGFLDEIPSQQSFVNAGVNIMLRYIAENRQDVEVTTLMVEACKLRLTRTYMSKLIELHLDCIIREHLPHLTQRHFKLADSVMGVDHIVEDDLKRYYIHVTSNTPFAHKMLIQKEKRGGYQVGRTYVQYSRDFSNDIILKYDTGNETDTTQMVNGFPLFKPDYIVWRMAMARKAKKVGEPLTTKYPKIQHFMDWARTQLNIDISEGMA